MNAKVNDKHSSMNTLKKIWTNHSIIFVFIALFLLCTIATGGKFAQWKNITTILRNASTVGMIALGMTFVIISGGIDLSSGPVMAIAGMVMVFLHKAGMHLLICMGACILTAALIGLINGLIITKVKVPPFIVTLAVGIIARSVTMYLCNGATVTGNNRDTVLKSIGNGTILSVPTPFWILLIAAVILTILLTKTSFGTYVCAVGCNENAARYSGIRVDRIKIWTYVIAGICVGIASIIEASRMVAVSSTVSGDGYEFDAITAVLVGGTSLNGGRGKIYATVIGIILLYFVNNMMIQLDISTYLTGALKGAVIMIAVFLQARQNG